MSQVLTLLLLMIPTPGEAGASAPEVDRDLLSHLNRFSAIYQCRFPGEDSVAKRAESLLESIGEAEDPAVRKLLRFYEAECWFALGRIDEAKQLATEIVQDKSSMDTPQATHLLLKIEAVQPGKKPGAIKICEFMMVGRLARELMARFYPNGRYADLLLRLSPRRGATGVLPDGRQVTTVLTNMRFSPRTDSRLMAAAGRFYLQMNMFEESIRAGCLALGMMHSGAWISERTARRYPDMKGTRKHVGIWECIGDAYAQLGQWEKALGCYYKAVASGDAPEYLAPKLQAMQRALRDGTKPKSPLPKPDRGQLERISQYCIQTDLFDEALHAAEAAAAIEGRPNAALFAQIFTEKADVLEKCLKDYGAGGTFRGTVISHDNIDIARAQARKWSEFDREHR